MPTRRRVLSPLVSSAMAAFCLSGQPGRGEPPAVETPAPVTHAPADALDAEAAKAVENKAVAELIPLLGHERTGVRRHAEDRLKALLAQDAGAVEAACYDAYFHNRSPEIRMRARSVLVEYALHWSKPFLGVRLFSTKAPDAQGNLAQVIKISRIQPKSPAAQGGLQVDDVVRGIDRLEISSPSSVEAFSRYVSTLRPGTKVTVHIERSNKAKDVVIPLGRRPPDADNNSPPPDPAKCFRDYLKSKNAIAPPAS